ncbi:hypothetical protein HRbin36_00114 [bacterium HR36]|nr:hypothetical protein HRbin36_00114 [bacterium HR36]
MGFFQSDLRTVCVIFAIFGTVSVAAWATGVTPEDELAARIELELLADPVTFPNNWRVSVHSRGVELGAVVPGEDVRERALQLANRVTQVQIYDRIFVQTTPRPVKLPPRSPRELGEAVRQRLEQIGIGGTQGTVEMDIYPDASGMVTLRGRVPTLQDKLLASRCLRDLPNCLAVRNYLEVQAPAKSMSEELALAPVPPANSSNQADQPDPFVWRPSRALVLPSRRSLNSATRNAPSHNVRAVLYPSMRQFIQVAGNRSAGAITPEVELNPSTNIIPTTTYSSTILPAAQVSGQPYVTVLPKSYNPPLGSTPNANHVATMSPAPALSKTNQGPMLTYPVQHTSAVFRSNSSWHVRTDAEIGGATTTTSRYRSLPRFNNSSTTNADSRASERTSVGTGTAEQTMVGDLRADYTSMRSLPSVPVVASSPQGDAQRSPGTVSPSPSSINRPSPTAVTTPDEWSNLRNRVLIAQGSDVADVQLVPGPGKTLRLKLKVPSVEKIDRVASRLFQLPELAGYQIQPEFEIIPENAATAIPR